MFNIPSFNVPSEEERLKEAVGNYSANLTEISKEANAKKQALYEQLAIINQQIRDVETNSLKKITELPDTHLANKRRLI